VVSNISCACARPADPHAGDARRADRLACRHDFRRSRVSNARALAHDICALPALLGA
jgi:hypothetical protein